MIIIYRSKTQMNASEKLLTWKEQKEIIRFLVDGSGTVKPTSNVEANFSSDLLALILRYCKDERCFERDIKNFTTAREHELNNGPVPVSEVERIRKRYFGLLAEELTADECPQQSRPVCVDRQLAIFRLLREHLVKPSHH